HVAPLGLICAVRPVLNSVALPTPGSLLFRSLLFLVPPRPPTSTLFPYTTLFRSPPPSPRPGPRDARARDASRRPSPRAGRPRCRSEEHTSELQSRENLVCRLLLEKKNMRQPARCLRRRCRTPSTARHPNGMPATA